MVLLFSPFSSSPCSLWRILSNFLPIFGTKVHNELRQLTLPLENVLQLLRGILDLAVYRQHIIVESFFQSQNFLTIPLTITSVALSDFTYSIALRARLGGKDFAAAFSRTVILPLPPNSIQKCILIFTGNYHRGFLDSILLPLSFYGGYTATFCVDLRCDHLFKIPV